MNREITTEIETFYHLKYGFCLVTIHNLWKMSNNADELNRNMEAAKSLEKTFEGLK